MKIQSLSICVPGEKCVNKCKFCVARMHDHDYQNQIMANKRFTDLYEEDFRDRLIFCKEAGCNTVILTGDLEPQQSERTMTFIDKFSSINQHQLPSPFRRIEMQTTGVFIDDEMLRHFRNHTRISTMALSISSFNPLENADICGMPSRGATDINHLCSEIKRYDFNLRMCLNLNSAFIRFTPEQLLETCAARGANQVTFRVLYSSGNSTPQDEWIKNNAYPQDLLAKIKEFILEKATPMEYLEYGARKYSYRGMSIVLDDDCMAKSHEQEERAEYKYLILREDCKLYSKWDDKGSILY